MSLLHRAAVRKMILDRAKSDRAEWDCTRVSGKALDELEAKVQCLIYSGVLRHPTIGKTFLGF